MRELVAAWVRVGANDSMVQDLCFAWSPNLPISWVLPWVVNSPVWGLSKDEPPETCHVIFVPMWPDGHPLTCNYLAGLKRLWPSVGCFGGTGRREMSQSLPAGHSFCSYVGAKLIIRNCSLINAIQATNFNIAASLALKNGIAPCQFPALVIV